jgi:DNA-binding XRE family transcriptional regulator
MTYAEAIRLLRKTMLLTQTEFAEMLDISFGTVNRWESGQYEPTMKMKRKLAPLFEKYKIVVEVK